MTVSVWDIVGMVLPYGATNGWLCMLRAYFDDSGTSGRDPVVVVGGLLGQAEDWDRLTVSWRERLKFPIGDRPTIKKFHLSHLVGHFGEFADYQQAEIDAVRHDFRQLILGNHLLQISAAVSRPAWDALVVPPYRDHMGTAEEACVKCFVDRSLEIIRDIKGKPDLRIAFMYDRGRETENLKQLTDIFSNRSDLYPEIASFLFGKVEDFPPLQAADVIATENYWTVQHWLLDGHFTNSELHSQQLLNGMAGVGIVLDEKARAFEVARRGSDGKLS